MTAEKQTCGAAHRKISGGGRGGEEGNAARCAVIAIKCLLRYPLQNACLLRSFTAVAAAVYIR